MNHKPKTTHIPAVMQRYEPTRATIVVDTSAMFPLLVPLDKEFLKKVPQRQLFAEAQKEIRLAHMLTYLADNGCEVILPEIVTHTTGLFMRDGRSLNDAYPQKNAEKKSFQKVAHLADGFIRELPQLNAKGTNIRIEKPAPSDHSIGAHYLNAVWRAHHSNSSDLDKRSAYIIAHKSYPSDSEKDRAGKAALALIKSMKHTSTPIFYLSDGIAAGKAILEACPNLPVSRVGVGAMYEAFRQNDMLQELGINPSYMNKGIGKFIEYELFREYNIQWDPNSVYSRTDAGHKNLEKGETGPFRTMMRELADDLRKEGKLGMNSANSVVESVETQGKALSQIDKFKQKYGR